MCKNRLEVKEMMEMMAMSIDDLDFDFDSDFEFDTDFEFNGNLLNSDEEISLSDLEEETDVEEEDETVEEVVEEESDEEEIESDEEEIEIDEEEEIVIEEPKKKETKKVEPKKEVAKPVKKAATKPKAKVANKEVKEEEVKQPKRKLTMNRKNNIKTYQEMLDNIKETKVDAYNKVMEERAKGKTSSIPVKKRITKTDFVTLMTLKSKESDAVKKALLNFVKQLGVQIPKGEEESVMEDCVLVATQMKAIYEELFVDIAYDLVSMGSGLDLLDKEDCKFGFMGEKIDKKLFDNTKLNISSSNGATHTLVKDYVRVTSISKSPESCKVKGTIKNGKFVPVKK